MEGYPIAVVLRSTVYECCCSAGDDQSCHSNLVPSSSMSMKKQFVDLMMVSLVLQYFPFGNYHHSMTVVEIDGNDPPVLTTLFVVVVV